jgi:hypothetical protein
LFWTNKIKAFSATGALEGAYAIKNGNLQSFSEQQFVGKNQGMFVFIFI